MRTPSHFIITAALRKVLPKQAIATSGFLLGSIAPDVPLYVLSISRTLYQYFTEGRAITSLESFAHDDLYFNNPFWIASHNLLHAPLILMVILVLTWRNRFLGKGRSWQLFWFGSAALLHSVIDIFTHHVDGPVLLFPLNWSWRFQSPISYCDPAYYGQWFSLFEYSLDALLVLYLAPNVWRWLRQKRYKLALFTR